MLAWLRVTGAPNARYNLAAPNLLTGGAWCLTKHRKLKPHHPRLLDRRRW